MDTESAVTQDVLSVNFKLPPPRDLSEEEQTRHVRELLKRIWEDADDLKVSGDLNSAQAGGHAALELWMLLLVRMVTRVAYPSSTEQTDEAGDAYDTGSVVHDFYVRQDQKRQILCDFIMSDFPARCVVQFSDVVQ
jgi:symplekin